MYKSQFGQDKWVDDILNQKTNGIFIDMGGCRPEKTSNSWFFEKHRDWNGIIIEANPKLCKTLSRDRNSTVLNNIAYSKGGLDKVFLVLYPDYSLSCIEECINEDIDAFSERRRGNRITRYQLKTISVSDLPFTHIDYLSIDVEGADVEVIKGIDFSIQNISCITIEHNKNQKHIKEVDSILLPLGYNKLEQEIENWYYK